MSVYATSDLHGNYDIWKQIREYITPEDTLYVLGDSADRGEYGWQMIKEALDMPNCVYLYGNHDKMLCDALYHAPEAMELHRYNGGAATEKAYWNDPNGKQYLAKLNASPLYAFYTNKKGEEVYLSHAGCRYEWANHRNVFSGEKIYEPIAENFVWDRVSYAIAPENEMIYVFGHTPSDYIYKDLSKREECYREKYYMSYEGEGHPLWIFNYKKCCIDCWTAHSNKALLLNLDTWEHIPFKG